MRLISITDDKIKISFPYDTADLARVKTLPDRRFVPIDKEWEVPLTPFHASKVIETLEDAGFQIPPRLYSLAEQTNVRSKFHIKRDGLYDFQSEAIDFLDRCGGRALIADEQGLGKTIEALYWLSTKPDVRKILVVAPASVVYKWKMEVGRWDKKRTAAVIEHTSDKLPEENYIIMSYAIMTRKAVELGSTEWDCIIFDECHKIKDSKSQRSRAAKSLEAKYILALSGTPILNRPVEFFNILHMISPAQWSSWWSYTARYCGARDTYWGRDVSGASNLEELSQRISPYMIRRLKMDVLEELPDLTRTKVPVQVDASEINQAYRQLHDYLREHGKGMSGQALVHLNILRQAVGRAKVPYVVQLAKDLLDDNPDKKVVIYAVHKAVVQELTTALYDYGVSTITGEVSQLERSQRQKRFQESQLPRVMIISSAGGEGIDLYRADVFISAEREWTPAAEEQAEARLHRIGQKSAVEAMYVIAENTVDESIDELIEAKRMILGQLIIQPDIELSIANDLMDKIMYGGK